MAKLPVAFFPLHSPLSDLHSPFSSFSLSPFSHHPLLLISTQEIDTPGVIQRVSTLFRGYNKLILVRPPSLPPSLPPSIFPPLPPCLLSSYLIFIPLPLSFSLSLHRGSTLSSPRATRSTWPSSKRWTASTGTSLPPSLPSLPPSFPPSFSPSLPSLPPSQQRARGPRSRRCCCCCCRCC